MAVEKMLCNLIEEILKDNPHLKEKVGATFEKISAMLDPKSDPSPMELAQISGEESSDDDDYSTSTSSDEYEVVTGGKRRKGKASALARNNKSKKTDSAAPTASPKFSPCPSPLPTTSSDAITSPPTAKKAKSPPPIYLQDKSKWTEVSKLCVDNKVNFTSARNCQQGVKISVPTSNDYRSLTRILKVGNISFHTYSLPEDTPTRVVIRRVPKEIPTDEIRDDLIAQKVPVTAVHRLHKARGGQQYDMVLVVCSHTEGHNPIFGITSVCSLTGISIERPYRPTLVGQCHRCQLYGHSQANCFATPRCVKCTGDHGTQECPRPKDRTQCSEPPSCVLCGQVGHPANYRGCPKAPKIAPKLAKRFDARQKRESPSAFVPKSQTPPRLAPQRTSPWGKLNHLSVAPQSNPQAIPALMDIPIPAPPAAPMTAQSNKVATTTVAAASPSHSGPAQNPRRSVADIIIGAYAIWMTDEARALAAEIAEIEATGQLTPGASRDLFNRYPTITEELDNLIFQNGKWVRK